MSGALLQYIRPPLAGDNPDTCNYCRERAPAVATLTTDADLVPRPVTRLCLPCLHRIAEKAVEVVTRRPCDENWSRCTAFKRNGLPSPRGFRCLCVVGHSGEHEYSRFDIDCSNLEAI